MGQFTKRMYANKKIPSSDLLKIQVMFVKLPPVSLKATKTGKLISVDHYKNLTELYHSGGLKACSEYYQNMQEKHKGHLDNLRAKIPVAHKKMTWRERLWMKIMNLIEKFFLKKNLINVLPTV